MSAFARTQYLDKYAHKKSSGRKEEWPETARRVAEAVMKPYFPRLTERCQSLIEQRKFMPGGRYLSAAGRREPFINNCFLFQAEDSRESWADIMYWTTSSLMVGGGVGVVYSKLREEGRVIDGLGGTSSGPIALMRMVNEGGRYVRQGGARRSAIWAGLHWDHPDIFKFIHCKRYSDLWENAKRNDFEFPLPMEGTNVSVILDDAFFAAYHDPQHPKHTHARDVYWESVRSMLKNGEPGFSVDVGDNAGENLRNAPVHGDTKVLTDAGYQRAADLADAPATVWTGKQWASDVTFRKTADLAPTVRVLMTGGREIVCEPSHPFLIENGKQVVRVPASELQEGDSVVVSLPQPPAEPIDHTAYTLGFIYGDGSFCRGDKAELSVCHPSKEPCLKSLRVGLSNRLGNDARGYTRIYYDHDDRLKGHDKTRVPSLKSYREIMSFLAGLFDADGNADPTQKRFRLSSVSKDFLEGVRRMLESIGILSNVSKGGPSGYGGRVSSQLVVAGDSMHRFMEVIPTYRVRLDLTGYDPYRRSTVKVLSVTPDEPADVYCADVGVEEHSFQAEGVLVSNCTEVTSSDNLDMCNLGHFNLARYDTAEEFADDVIVGTAFLVAGTLYSKLPVEGMYRVREKNRRLGLGLMGVHEWLLRRGYRYGPCEELGRWLDAYVMSGSHANLLCDRLSISRPAATRSMAPTGTTSIVAETTSSGEPIPYVAYKRRYRTNEATMAQYVVDPTAHRLIQAGLDPDMIEDSVALASDVERRIDFQVWLQERIDHGISSTINLPPWDSPLNNGAGVTKFGDALMERLPKLRGITTYPDGSRGGQPLTKVPYEEAIKQVGVEFLDNAEHSCKTGVCAG